MARTLQLALASLALVLNACASNVTQDGGIDPGASGGEGGEQAGGGGSGGSTSNSSSSSSASTGGSSNCAQDCSTIDVPDCFSSVCNELTGNCEVMPAGDGAACDDGLFCTANDTCQAGGCVGGPPNDCGASTDPCTALTCDEDARTCSATPAPNGTACVPNDLCSMGGICINGGCIGTPKDCSFAPVPDECHTAVCEPATGACVPVVGNDGLSCDFGDLCMVSKVCSAGQCVGGSPKNCSMFTNGCNNGVCDPLNGACYGEAIPPGGMCLEATDTCNVGICNAAGQCLPNASNDGGICSDGNGCTIMDACAAGTCTGIPDVNYQVYFTETFASNVGWTLGTEWQIGPAVAGPVGGFTPDPGLDHTTSADNGLAGVVIGGNASIGLHPFSYLTSPVINTSTVPGSLYLEYWRFLNSDYLPYMNNVVEVYNGSTWVQIWQSGPSPGIADSTWTKHSFDITPHKNANLQVRWGFLVGSSGVYTIGSWSLDDVVLASSSCTTPP